MIDNYLNLLAWLIIIAVFMGAMYLIWIIIPLRILVIIMILLSVFILVLKWAIDRVFS